MRSCSFLAFAAAICLLTSSCKPALQPEIPAVHQEEPENKGDDTDNDNTSQEQAMTISITIGGKVFKADIENTETGKAFVGKLPLTLDMSELNGNEKYCYGVDLPHADRHFESIAAGDLMLYSGNCIVLFYGSAGGYSYTRIGKLTGTDGLKAALGSGSVRVTFSK